MAAIINRRGLVLCHAIFAFNTVTTNPRGIWSSLTRMTLRRPGVFDLRPSEPARCEQRQRAHGDFNAICRKLSAINVVAFSRGWPGMLMAAERDVRFGARKSSTGDRREPPPSACGMRHGAMDERLVFTSCFLRRETEGSLIRAKNMIHRDP